MIRVKIPAFILLILLLCFITSYKYAQDYVIYLGCLDSDLKTTLLTAYHNDLEPFYPLAIEDFRDIYVLSESRSGAYADDIISYLSRFDCIEIERAKYYEFQHRNLPDDPQLPQQYALYLSNFTEAWSINTGNDDIVVGVVDSGIDYNHEDLHERIWINEGEIPNNGIDDDDNGFIDDYMGWNFVSASPHEVYPGETPGPNNNPIDFSGHGTAVSGILGAITNNGIGIAGASHRSRIMAVKSGYVNSEGNGVLKDIDAARGIVYAAQNGAHIINMSWGDIVESNIIRKAINHALRLNVILIAAAGNTGGNYLFFPASMESVISVGSTAANGNRSSFSNYSMDLDIFAYGENIRTTGIGNNYIPATGTSMSCAFATGAMVILKAHFPAYSNEMLRGQLISTATNTGFFNKAPFTGILNMYRGLTIFPAPNIVLADYQFFNSNNPHTNILPGDDVSLLITLKNLWRTSGNLAGIITVKDPHINIYHDGIDIAPIPTFTSFTNTDNPFLLNFTTDFYYGKRAKIRLLLSQESSAYSDSFTMEFVMPYPQNPGFPYHSGNAVVSSPLAVDTNNDGRKEIFWGNYNGHFYGIDFQGNLLEGFPIRSKAPFVSSPAYADLDNNGNSYIIFGGFDKKLYAVDTSGNHKEGFPVTLNGAVYGCTPVGKLDGDENNFIIAATLNGLLYAIDANGNVKPGFPVYIPQVSYSSPAIADLDKNNVLSVIIGGANSGLYVFNNNGTPRPNFPFFADSYIFSSPSVADIDNDGKKEIVFASYDYKLYAVDRSGNLKPGFPVNLGGPIFSSPALYDINQDGYLNIILGCGNPGNKLYALNHIGDVLEGFPVESVHAFSSSPSVYDIDNDGFPDIAIGSYSEEIYIIKHTGESFLGFPYPVGAEILSSPTFADVDSDGDIDLIFGDHKGMLHILDLQFPKTSPVDNYWFTFRGNYQRTGTR